MIGRRIGVPLLLVFTSMFLTMPASADLAEDCVDAYKGNVSNVVMSERDAAENAASFHKYCRTDGSVDKTSLAGNVGFVVGTTPITIGMSSGTDDQKMSSFCDQGAKSNGFTEHSSLYSKTIVVGAQENLNECLLLAKSNISIKYKYQPPRLVTISGSYTPTLIAGTYPDAFFDSISYDNKKITCSSNSLHENGGVFAKKVLDEHTKQIKLNGGFTIECVRIPSKYNGKDFYPDVQISTSILAQGNPDPFNVSVPAVENYGPALSTEYQTELDGLKKQIADTNVAKDQALQLATSLQTQLAAAQARVANAHVVASAAVLRSDDDFPGDVLTRIGCADTAQAWADRWCPANTEHRVDATASKGGPACGWSVYAVSCLLK